MIGLLIYVCMSATGLTLIKIGTGQASSLVLNKQGVGIQLNWILILGLCMYVMSFLLSILVMKRMNLSVFYPLSAGAVYILICLLCYFVLHESISISQLVGMGIILAGIVVMNLGKV